MIRELLAKLISISRAGARSRRVSILLPFLIISAGLGVLSWRSYHLSVKMERGADTLAAQYAGYAADITARRVDAAVRAELSRATDEWQTMERRTGEPVAQTVQDWMNQFHWVISALYVPDADPASSIFFSDVASTGKRTYLSREFFSANGTVRYQYDPARLLDIIHAEVRQQPLIRTGGVEGLLPINQQPQVSVVSDLRQTGLRRVPHGFAFVAPLAEPMKAFGIQGVLPTSFVGSGWENQRVLSLWMSALAILLTGIGAMLAFRGLHKESETMKLRGALIANVSHELRTPLSMIRLGAETLKRGSKLKPHERDQIEDQILREVLLLSHLVENVLDVARIQNGGQKALAFTPVHPRDLVKNLLTTYDSWIRSKGFAVGVTIDDTIGEQMWDRDSVSRALLNLIDNAIKYSGEDRRIDVELRQTADHIVLEVKDHGIGIDSKDAARIFDPYYRAKFSDTTTRRGAGLGLTLVQQILASHGGLVELESVPGQGSTFRLLFPRDLAGDPVEVPNMARAREAF